MASYEYACYACDWKWMIQHDMVTIVDHVEHCPDCTEKAERLYSIGMIKVQGGNSPTRMGDTYQRVPKSRDPGFQKEFASIYEEAGMQDPNTKEEYKIQEDENSDIVQGPYLAPDSQRDEHRRAVKLARDKGTLPTMDEMDDARAKFHDNSLKRARERLKQWPAARKGKRT